VEEFTEKVNKFFVKKIEKMYYSYDKNKLVYECQKEMVREFKSSKSGTDEQKEEFVKNLIDFGKDPRSRVKNWISRKIKEIAKNIKKEYSLYQNLEKVLQDQLDELERIIRTSNTFPSLEKELGRKLGTSLHFLEIEKNEHSSVMKSLKNHIFDNDKILNEIYMNVEVRNVYVIIKQYQKGTTFCMKRCFVCGAPCLKNKGHDSLENNHKHETNFHIPIMFLSNILYNITL
jgi:polyhydroxyalkanoate synthesis regulator phasin